MTGPLEGLRVIDLSSGPVAGIATMVLSDFGADVVKIERPGGDPFRFLSNSPMWLRGKRSVELDLKDKVGQEHLYELTDAADVVVSNFRARAAIDLGCDYDVLASRNSRIVYLQLDGFGSSGPYMDLPGYEGVVAAKSGRMQNFAGTASRAGPQFASVRVASHAAAQATISGVLAGLIARERIGLGQYIETSMLRGMIPYEQGELIRLQLANTHPSLFGGDDPLLAPGKRMPSIQYQPVLTKGGQWMQPGNLLKQQFDSFIAAAEMTDVLVDDRTQGSPATWDPDVLEEVRDKILLRMQEKTADEWIEQFTELGNIAAHKFQTTQQALSDPDIIENGHLVEVTDPRLGVQIKEDIAVTDSIVSEKQFETQEEQARCFQLGLIADLEHTPGQVGGAAPLSGQHTLGVLKEKWDRASTKETYQDDAEPPLSGLTVLEFASIIAVPLGVSQLADLGARVIKVEPMGGDPYRQLADGVGAMRVNTGKESIAINLKTEVGQEILKKLLVKTDLIVSNFRPGVPERLGFGYEQVKEIRPEVVYLAMNGYGRSGPGVDRPSAHPVPGAGVGGALFQAGAEVLSNANGGDLDLKDIREISRRLARSNEVNPDPNVAMVVMTSALLALYAQRTGQGGQRVWIDMFGANAYANADDFIRYHGKPDRAIPDRNLYGTGPLSRLYECKEGWIFLEVLLESEWVTFCERIEHLALGDDQRFATREAREANEVLLTELLSEMFAQEVAEYWESLFLEVGLGCVRADGPAAGEFWATDPYAAQAGMVTPVTDSKWGNILRHGPLWNISRSSLSIGAAPLFGENTDALLGELGYGVDVIAQLHKDGIVDAAVVEM